LVFKFAGLTITLNQQIPDLSESAGITTNAMALDFNRFPFGTNVLNGSVDVGQSFATRAMPRAGTPSRLAEHFESLECDN
jgi:hypothetical protein